MVGGIGRCVSGPGPSWAGSDVGRDPDDDLDACFRDYAPLVGCSCGDDRLGGVELASAEDGDDGLARTEGTFIAREPLDGNVVSVRIRDDGGERDSGAETLTCVVEDSDVRREVRR